MMKAIKFDIGDKVKILDGSKIENYESGWADEMDKFVGKIGTILDNELGEYVLSEPEFEFYVFDERGLELVESAESVRLRHLESVFGRNNIATFCLINAYDCLLKYKSTNDRVYIFEAKSWTNTYNNVVKGSTFAKNVDEWAERIIRVVDKYINKFCK